MQLCLAQEQELVFYTRNLVWFLLGRSFIVVYGLYTVNYPLSEIEKGDIFFCLTSKKIKGRTVIFWRGYEKYLQKLFAESEKTK